MRIPGAVSSSPGRYSTGFMSVLPALPIAPDPRPPFWVRLWTTYWIARARVPCENIMGFTFYMQAHVCPVNSAAAFSGRIRAKSLIGAGVGITPSLAKVAGA